MFIIVAQMAEENALKIIIEMKKSMSCSLTQSEDFILMMKQANG